MRLKTSWRAGTARAVRGLVVLDFPPPAAKAGDAGQRANSVEIFHEGVHAGCGARHGDLGHARDDRDGPAMRDRLALEHRSHVTGDRRSARPDGRDSAVELRDAEAADFFLVSCFEREHEVPLLCSRNYRPFVLSVCEKTKP